MKKSFFLLYIFTLSCTSFSLLANSLGDDEFESQIQRMRKMMEEVQAESLQMDKIFEKLRHDFFSQREGFDSFGFHGGISSIKNNQVITEWSEDSRHKILKLKFSHGEKIPLDIKIKNGLVKLSGNVRESSEQGSQSFQSVSSFSQSFSIPAGVNSEQALIEEEKDALVIKFPKISSKQEDQLKPIDPSDEAVSI